MNLARIQFLPALAVSVALLAGCGSASKSSSTNPGGSAAASTAATSTASASAASTSVPVVVTAKQSKLGTILAAGKKRLTVYLFGADKGSSSACTGACAAAWPPVLGKASVAGAAMSADLGSITRPDGTTQVTYKGHPLYFFTKDKDDGDAYGEGVKAFGADWYVLAPSGNKVDKS
jgi:predicted lipoprotein with Yx(FWY)xxD motif